MYVAEGLENLSEQEADAFAEFSINSIAELSKGRTEGHYALKLTALINAQAMRRMSEAQEQYRSKVLMVSFDKEDEWVLTEE